MTRDRLDGVMIDTDEDGFHLILSGEQSEYDFVLPADVALELRNAVRVEIDPWVREGGLSMRIAREDVEAGR